MITSETLETVRTIRLDRPDARNALTPESVHQLHEAIRSSGDAHAVVLEGAGSVFCAGFDLKLCAADPSGDTMRALLRGLHDCIAAMRALPCPVVLAAHGAAIAGGCALLGGADLVVSDRNAKLGYPVVKIGVSPAVSAPFLAVQTTPGFARSRLLEPELIRGEEAERRGLVQVLVEERSQVIPEAHARAQQLAAKPTWGVAATKSWLNQLTASETDGLSVSLSLAGSDEEQRMLAAAWSAQARSAATSPESKNPASNNRDSSP